VTMGMKKSGDEINLSEEAASDAASDEHEEE
jgi:hypothetical protein